MTWVLRGFMFKLLKSKAILLVVAGVLSVGTAAAQEKEKDLSKSQAVERAKQVEKGRVLRVDQTSRNYRVKMLKKSGRVVSVDVDKRSGRVKDSQKGSSEH